MENSPILVEPQHGSNLVDSMFRCNESQEADSLLREAQVPGHFDTKTAGVDVDST